MSSLFFEKTIWGFFVLVGALIAMIYKLFNNSLLDRARVQRSEIKVELTKEFDLRFGNDIRLLKEEIMLWTG